MTDLEVICSSIDNQNASLQEVTSAVEQISEEGIKILDKINETSTFAQAISQELIDGVDTIEEVIESSEKLREEIAFFKI